MQTDIFHAMVKLDKKNEMAPIEVVRRRTSIRSGEKSNDATKTQLPHPRYLKPFGSR